MRKSVNKGMCVLPLLMLPGLALAAPPPAAIDAYYVPQSTLNVDVEGEGGDIDGDGFGIRALVPVGGAGFRLGGEYQMATLDDVGGEIDVNQTRLGAGWMSQDQLRLGGLAEYVGLELKTKVDGFGTMKSKANGYGLHARAEYDVIPQLQVYGQVGYLKLDSDGESMDGFEYLIGAAYNINQRFGLFADYRGSKLDDSGDELKLDDLRIGARLLIGAN